MIMVKKNIIQFGNRTENVIFHLKKIFHIQFRNSKQNIKTGNVNLNGVVTSNK